MSDIDVGGRAAHAIAAASVRKSMLRRRVATSRRGFKDAKQRGLRGPIVLGGLRGRGHWRMPQ
jgi:hypothetical protein